MGRKRIVLGAALATLVTVVALAALLPWAVRAALWRRELNPVLRGERLAAEVGCALCHLPDGGREIPNPESRWGSVPRFFAGNAMMYAESRSELEEFIRFGAPRAWLDDPAARARLEAQHLRMPAYGGRLSRRQIADLVAYAAAAEGVEPVGAEDPAVTAGRALAREQGCTACHGIEGAGGRPNPGSLGGFIPGFVGANFRDLVRDREEFRTWVLDGTSPRLERNPLVRWFWRRQAIAMPAYRDLLDDGQVDALWAWVEALRGVRPVRGSGTDRGP